MLPGNPPQLTITKHKLETMRLDTTRERLAWDLLGISKQTTCRDGRESYDCKTLISTLLPICFLPAPTGKNDAPVLTNNIRQMEEVPADAGRVCPTRHVPALVRPCNSALHRTFSHLLSPRCQHGHDAGSHGNSRTG